MKLSKSEEQLMSYVWDKPGSTLMELLDSYEEPRPAKTTIATLLKRMIDKGYIDYTKVGGARKYIALQEKKSYFSQKIKGFVHQFFNNSNQQFASFFAEEADLSQEELMELRNLIDKQLKERK